jgi:hypothetical protein
MRGRKDLGRNRAAGTRQILRHASQIFDLAEALLAGRRATRSLASTDPTWGISPPPLAVYFSILDQHVAKFFSRIL